MKEIALDRRAGSPRRHPRFTGRRSGRRRSGRFRLLCQSGDGNHRRRTYDHPMRQTTQRNSPQRNGFGDATMQASTVSNGERGGIHVGCSGWVYKHWRGLFYPEGLPQKRWFERYSEEFDTVEINASFYRSPLASTFEGWRDKAP